MAPSRFSHLWLNSAEMSFFLPTQKYQWIYIIVIDRICIIQYNEMIRYTIYSSILSSYIKRKALCLHVYSFSTVTNFKEMKYSWISNIMIFEKFANFCMPIFCSFISCLDTSSWMYNESTFQKILIIPFSLLVYKWKHFYPLI